MNSSGSGSFTEWINIHYRLKVFGGGPFSLLLLQDRARHGPLRLPPMDPIVISWILYTVISFGLKTHCATEFLFFFISFFLNFFLSDAFTCPILEPLVPLFWTSGDIFSGFQSQSGFCLIHIAEVNVMYIPWDPLLVIHIVNLLTVSIVGYWLGSYFAQGYYWHQWGSNLQS